jgi:hypothetical protein
LRRGFSTLLIGVGWLMVQGGKVLAGLTALLAVYIGIRSIVQHEAPAKAAWIFPGAPLAAGVVNVLVSGPGALWMAWGVRLREGAPVEADGLDRITRKAIASEQDVRDIWAEELTGGGTRDQ